MKNIIVLAITCCVLPAIVACGPRESSERPDGSVEQICSNEVCAPPRRGEVDDTKRPSTAIECSQPGAVVAGYTIPTIISLDAKDGSAQECDKICNEANYRIDATSPCGPVKCVYTRSKNGCRVVKTCTVQWL